MNEQDLAAELPERGALLTAKLVERESGQGAAVPWLQPAIGGADGGDQQKKKDRTDQRRVRARGEPSQTTVAPSLGSRLCEHMINLRSIRRSVNLNRNLFDVCATQTQR